VKKKKRKKEKKVVFSHDNHIIYFVGSNNQDCNKGEKNNVPTGRIISLYDYKKVHIEKIYQKIITLTAHLD